MATIRKRNNSYEITVSCGYDITGKQIRHTTTYKPEPNMTARQIEKAVKHQAEVFEEKCKNGQVINGNIKFADFAEIWFNDRKADLRPKTYDRYLSMLPRINQAIGHLKLSKIQPPHLRAFYNNLAEGGIRQDGRYKCKIDLDSYIKDNGFTTAGFSRLSDVPNTTIISIRQGNLVKYNNAEKISKALNLPIEKVFEAVDKNKPLSGTTILHHHSLISSILSTAVEWGVLFSNPCERTKPPKATHKEPTYFDEKQSAELFSLLDTVDIPHKTIIRLLLFAGMRRGEVLGLKWSDIDFQKSLLRIERTLYYSPQRGVYEDKTKNESSMRTIKLSKSAIADLKVYKKWQAQQRLLMGDRWAGTEYIFTTDEGKPILPDSLSGWFRRFIKAHSDKLPYIKLHSLRHTNATLQIASNVPITTVSKRLGHTNPATTAKIYAHFIKSNDEASAETLEDILNPIANRNIG
jgi:integrase